MYTGIPKVDSTQILPPAPGIVNVITAVDYPLHAALADLVDNSVDAGATKVLIRFVHDAEALTSIQIVDNGKGMDEAKIDEAMVLGKQRDYELDELGMYGIGMKSASLSQAEVMTIASRSEGKSPCARQWTKANALRRFECGYLSTGAAGLLLKGPWPEGIKLESHGTVVQLDGIIRNVGWSLDKYISRRIHEVKHHLGLHFHRFLEGGTVEIGVDVFDLTSNSSSPVEPVAPMNPFKYPKSGLNGYPKTYHLAIGGLQLKVHAHVWPKGQQRNPFYSLDKSAARRQGFYFYRNDRLLQAGGWNGIREDSEPHLSLARVVIELPVESKEIFVVPYNKSGVQPPGDFSSLMATATSRQGDKFEDFIAEAQEAYRSRSEKKQKPLPNVKGLPDEVKQFLEEFIGFKSSGPVSIRQAKLPAHEAFRVDRESDALLVNRQLIHGEYAGAIKLLLFLLLEQYVVAQRMSDVTRDRLEIFSEAIAIALRETD